MKTTSKKIKIEDDLKGKKWKMTSKNNGRWPPKKNGRRPKKNKKNEDDQK